MFFLNKKLTGQLKIIVNYLNYIQGYTYKTLKPVPFSANLVKTYE